MRSLMVMEVSSLLSFPEGLRVEWIEPQGADLSVGVVSTRPSSFCPLCAQASSQIHSRYQRTLRDVPCGDRKVILHLSVGKFFCRTPSCTQKIFTERLSPFVEPWAQVATRLFEAVQAIGLATSGELGTRLADRIRIHSSPTTILRRIMAFVLLQEVLEHFTRSSRDMQPCSAVTRPNPSDTNSRSHWHSGMSFSLFARKQALKL